MSEADAGRLAPVTYLPWAGPASEGARDDDVAGDGPVDDSCFQLELAASRAEGFGDADADADDEAEAARAERVSMHALTRRGVSVGELRATLLSRELPEHIVEHELERLQRVGLLDDAALAEMLVRTLRERKKLGRTALAAELGRRRLDSAAIAAALDETDPGEELAAAIELARQRARQLQSLPPEVAQRRLIGFLQRRGYGGSTVTTAVQQALKPTGGPVFR